MSSAQVGAVLRQIRKLADARHDAEVPDHDLLERFARDRDEGSFAALLLRHGPMVLSVCRNVLHDWHDAEDAFQAAFLLLARKADSIHRREAVSSWLYRVAYRLAVRARANAARRRVVEKRAVTMPSADPVLDMSLREVRGVLFEELEKLPEQYRAPLVLCGLEEKSLEEAARLLGWTRWAVKGRLQRGRELLRNRLRRRGLELPVALSATALALGTATDRVSAALADSTLRAAVKVAAGGAAAGAVSPEVAALVHEAGKTLSHGTATIAAILSLALGVAATTFGVVWHGASAADPPPQARAEKPSDKGPRPLPDKRPAAPADATVEVRGRVLGPDGKPFAGAKLYLGRGRPAPKTFPVRATSGADGRFAFTAARPKVDDTDGETLQPQIMAVARGHGCDWAKIGSAKEELTLRLVKDVPVRGRILDPDGRPLAGARLRVTYLSAPKGDDLGAYLEAFRKGRPWEQPLTRNWEGPLPGLPALLTTDADGRFELAGVGRERLVYFRLEGPAIATTGLDPVMTRAADKVVGPNKRRIYGASFDHVGLASRPVRGVVRDKATGKPLAGVTVGHYHGQSPNARTDKAGRYEVLGLVKARHYVLVTTPVDGLYFHRRVEVADTPGLGPLTADIELVRALTLRGKVTDPEGKPIAGARVDYHPLGGNSYVDKLLSGSWDPRSETTTGPDGGYVITVMPGPGVVGVKAPRRRAYMPAAVPLTERKAFFKTRLVDDNHERYFRRYAGGGAYGGIGVASYNATVLLEPAEKEKNLVKDVVLERPHVRKGRVLGPDGRALTGVTVMGLAGHSPFHNTDATLKGNEFTVRDVNPMANRPLVFYHKSKNLGFYLKDLRRVPPGPVTVKLRPCGSASGRVVDPDGQAVAGLRLHVPMRAVSSVGQDRWVTTDKQGRFRAEGLVAGLEYWVWDASGSFPGVFARVVVESGKHKDMGDIKMTERRE
jgi:RNA polymerase sigma factor (sigma-70 family)